MSSLSRRAQESVILLPGLLGTIEGEWQPHLESIKHYHLQVIGIDWPYHKDTTAIPPSLSFQTLVDETIRSIEALGLERIVVWGYSLGGYVALEIERRSPGLLEGIWMHATKFFWSDKDIALFRKELTIESMSPRRKELLLKQFGDRWEQLVLLNSSLFEDILENGLTLDDLLDVRIPVLVTAGDQDEFVSPSEVERLADILSGGEWQILNGVRHSLHSTRSSLIIPTAMEFTRRILGNH